MDRKKILKQFLMADIISALIVWILFMVFRKIVVDAQIFTDINILVPNYNILPGFLFFPLSCLFVYYLTGIYIRPDKQSGTTTLFSTFIATGIISFVIFFVLLIDDLVVTYQYYYNSLFVLFALLFSITFIFRYLIIKGIKRAIRKGEVFINTIIIGTGKNALLMSHEIEKNAIQYRLKGFVSIENNVVEVPKERIIGYYNSIGEIIQKNNIGDVIISLDNPDEFQLFKIINQLYKFDVEIRFTPRLYEILTGGSRIKMIGVSPLVIITTLNMPDWQFSFKRLIDVVVSVIALILLSPLLIYFMIKVKTDSKGPVFYKQERIGYQGKPFKIFKFRTMYVNSENGTPKLSSAFDMRITPVGRILRKYRIDELPQFVNILLGDMSLVGPRPERSYYIKQIIEVAPYYCLLYKIRPGLTSWGPIKIGYSDTVEKMIERLNYDIIYLDNMSLINDFKILFQTIEIIFKGKGM